MCNQSVDQVIGLLIFQSKILASTLEYHSQNPHLIPPVPISVPLSWNFHHFTLLFISNQQKVVFQTTMLVLELLEFWMDVLKVHLFSLMSHQKKAEISIYMS